MKIALHPNQMFWGLMNPVDLKLTLSLTEVHPSTEIDESKLHAWEIKQIIGSVKDKRISISVQVEDLIKSLPAALERKEKKTVPKRAVSASKIKA
jgi:hypothetical protein